MACLFEFVFMPRTAKGSVVQATKSTGPLRRGGPASAPPVWIAPQLCQLVEQAPSASQWVHEVKLDGYRMAARIVRGRVQLLTRSGGHGSPGFGSREDGCEICDLLRHGDPVDTPFGSTALDREDRDRLDQD